MFRVERTSSSVPTLWLRPSGTAVSGSDSVDPHPDPLGPGPAENIMPEPIDTNPDLFLSSGTEYTGAPSNVAPS